MTAVREFGQRRLTPQRRPAAATTPAPKREVRGASGAFSFAKLATAGLIVGFVIGAAMLMSAPGRWDALRAVFGLSHSGLDFSGPRIGRAATAPVLKLCLTKDVIDMPIGSDIPPDILLSVLKESARGRVTRSPNSPREHNVIELAQMWSQVADCVYRQNAASLCDIDNRALAIESAGIFVRQADRIAEQPPKTYAALPGEIAALQSTRDRVLGALRQRVSTGVLIASDFPSSFSPPALRAALDGTETTRNDCAKPAAANKP